MIVTVPAGSPASLEAAVRKLVDSRPEFLPDNKRVRDNRLSLGTGAYSQARTRMPLAAAEWFANQVSQSLIESRPPSFGNRRVFLIDGTTSMLAPERALQQLNPPASNQHGWGVWPVALLTVCHELSSGAARTIPTCRPALCCPCVCMRS